MLSRSFCPPHPAHPVSVSILHPREIQAVTKLRHRRNTYYRNAVKGGSRQCNAMSYWIRQAQQKHARNPDTLRKIKTARNKRKAKKRKKIGKHVPRKLILINTNDNGRPKRKNIHPWYMYARGASPWRADVRLGSACARSCRGCMTCIIGTSRLQMRNQYCQGVRTFKVNRV